MRKPELDLTAWRGTGVAIVAAVALASTGCGTRMSHEAVVRGATRVAVSSPAPGAAPVPGGSELGTSPADAMSPAGGPVGADVGAATAPANSAPASGSAAGKGASGGGGTAAPASGGSGSAPAGRTTGAATPAAPKPGVPSPAPGGGAPAGPRSDLVIGSVGTLSGPAGEPLAGIVQGVQVWVRAMNDRGGVNGHRIRYVVADDGGDSAKHLALLQQFVDRDRVVAFVGKPEPLTGPAVNDWHRAKRIPVVGNEGGSNYVYQNPMYFPVFPSGDELAFSVLGGFSQVAIPAGNKKLGIISCVEAEACSNFERVWSSPRGTALGFQVAYKAKVSLTQPDFTAECLGARNAGAQIIGFAADINSVGRFAAACHRQNYRPTLAIASNILVPSALKNPDFDGTVIGVQHFAWVASDSPGRKEFHDVFARYLPGADPTPFNAAGWIMAKVFEEATKALPEPPTTQAILEGLWSIKNNDFGGLTYPLAYTRDQPTPKRSCWSVVLMKDGKYTAPGGGSLTCEK